MQRSAFAFMRIFIRFFACILLVFLLMLLLPCAAAGGDDGKLRGRIIQAGSQDPIPGVVVRLVEMSVRSVTNSEGRFSLESVNPGRYTMLASHPQFVEQRFVLQVPVEEDLEIEMQSIPHFHETVTVTAAPWAVDRADVAQSANVLDTSEVRARTGLSVGEAVGNLPGVRNISTGEAGGAPMIRGQTNERVRVLSNGFPHDYYQFSRRHMPNIETYDSSFIEVIRGPASVLYGTQAMGGLANLVSAPTPTAKTGNYILNGEGLFGYANNNAARIGHAQIEGARGGFGGRVAWTQRSADNIRTPGGDLPNTDYDQLSGLLEIGYRSPAGFRIRGQYRHWQNDLGFYIPIQPDFRLNLENDVGEMEASGASSWGDWRIAANISRNTRQAFPAGRSRGAKVDLQLMTQNYRASLQHKPSGPFRGWIQMEYTRQKNESFGPVTLLPYYRNRTWAAALYEEIRLVQSGTLDRLVLNLGLRYDHRLLDLPANPQRGILHDFRKSYAPITGSVGAVYRFNRTLSAGLSFSRGWRNPSEYELFADGPHDGALLYENGNPDLREETNFNTEFTLRMEGDRARGFLALYRSRFDDYIYQKLSGGMRDGLPVGIFNQSDAIVKGFEMQAAVDASPWLTLSIAGDMLRSKNIATGTRLPFSPPDRAMFAAHFHDNSSADWIHPYIEISSTFMGKGSISGPDEPFPLDTAGYALLDLGAGVQRRLGKYVMAFDLRISNLADRAYKGFLDTYKLYALSPGRNIRATLRFLF
ncbi:MAG: TonB-dependent receptor [Acidobacteria bacterium]|nr:TonB-dependent receptor [Acidobacteriota bacterium]